MKKYLSIAILLIALVVLCSSCTADVEPLNAARVALAPKHIDPRCAEVAEDGSCKAYLTSIVELLANPEKYHGKMVAVSGYINLEFESNAIHLSRDHYEYMLGGTFIWLDVSELKLDPVDRDFRQGYGYVQGVFDRYDGGHYRICSGGIGSITKLKPLPKKAT